MARDGIEYRILSKNLKNKYKQAEDEQLNKKYIEVESLQVMDIAGMHKTIKEMSGKKTSFSNRMYKV